MEEGELLVAQNTYNIDSDASADDKSILEYQLNSITRQKPNKTFFSQPIRMKWHYRIHRKLEKNDNQDTSKIHKLLLKRFVEAPVLYDRDLMEESTESMTYFLNNLGYFYADVKADTIPSLKRKTVEVTYNIKLRQLLQVDTTIFTTEDDSIKPILPDLIANTLLQKDVAISKVIFNNEKNRIATTLQNIGFANFYPNYVFFEGDTTQAKSKARVVVTIASPSDTTFHQRYKIGNTYIYTQYNPLDFRTNINYDTLTVDGYEGFYLLKPSDSDKYLVKPKPILNAFAFKKGDNYSADAYNKTRKQLSTIAIYQFVRVRPVSQTENSNIIDFYVYMNPDEKMALGADIELNSITNNITTVNNFGIFANVSLKHRNFLRGAEVFSISPIAGIEFDWNRSNGRFFNTVDIRLQGDFATTTIRNSRFNWMNESQFHLTTVYNYISRTQLYQYNLFSLSGNFDWDFENSRRIITPAFVNFVLPNIDPLFQPTLDQNPLLARSFDRQLIFGSNISYQRNKPISSSGVNQGIRINAESAGFLLNIADQFIQPANNFEFFDTISYSQFTKAEFNYTFSKRFNEKTSWANRFNFGIGIPYGNSTEMPYVKQYFSGGDGSVRAWQVREIGPGAYVYPYLYDDVVPFQTGNLKIEMNTELRFKLSEYYGFDAAVFVDAGNVWLLDDPENLNRVFAFDTFLSQIAIGTGFGFRKDFGFFLMRFDLGYKVRTPYVSETNQVGTHFFPVNWWRDPNYIIAIGYPF